MVGCELIQVGYLYWHREIDQSYFEYVRLRELVVWMIGGGLLELRPRSCGFEDDRIRLHALLSYRGLFELKSYADIDQV